MLMVTRLPIASRSSLSLVTSVYMNSVVGDCVTVGPGVGMRLGMGVTVGMAVGMPLGMAVGLGVGPGVVGTRVGLEVVVGAGLLVGDGDGLTT